MWKRWTKKQKRRLEAALFDLTEKTLQRRFDLKTPRLEECFRDVL